MKKILFAMLFMCVAASANAQQKPRVICEGVDSQDSFGALGMKDLQAKVTAINSKIAGDATIKNVSAPTVSIHNTSFYTLVICVTVYY
jgi:hypothetical protein